MRRVFLALYCSGQTQLEPSQLIVPKRRRRPMCCGGVKQYAVEVPCALGALVHSSPGVRVRYVKRSIVSPAQVDRHEPCTISTDSPSPLPDVQLLSVRVPHKVHCGRGAGGATCLSLAWRANRALGLAERPVSAATGALALLP